MSYSKKKLRASMRAVLQTIPQTDYLERSACIAKTLYQQNEWLQAQSIGITLSFFPEVDTKAIITEAWSQGKQVAVPKCEPKLQQMEFRILTDFSQLETVYSGLLEPNVEQTSLTNPEELDLLIVPGLAFDERGYRLGFGGGYYDRYLSSFSGNTISLAFLEQLTNKVLIESHDLPVKKIVSEKQIFNCQQSEVE